MNAPFYFIDNQQGANPHYRLDPSESARILRAHVLDGVELVTRHRMGTRIADFVREHHGTSELRMLKERADGLGRSADEDTYRYPGPRPRSRETAIVMLADRLEATARSTPPVDEAACDTLVRATIERTCGEGQLDDAGMTDAELAQARGGLARTLEAMYHRRRLMYPSSDAGPARRRLAFFDRSRRGRAS
jgi:membrane-associated HD superfamily phosphohydrolase